MIERSLSLPCGLVLPNRLAKSATTEALAGPGDLPSERLLTVYRRWGAGRLGMVITGNVSVVHDHMVRPGEVVVTRETPLEPLRTWAAAIREHGTRAILQLNHAGRQTLKAMNPRPLGPSAVRAVKMFRAFGEPREATAEEIADVIRRFGDAAEKAEAAGFDGVQVHSAHGYLLSQFLSPLTNRREDAWGGPVEHRARLLLACVREVRRRVSPRFAVTVKLNTADFQRGGFSEEEGLQVVRLLEGEGVDLLELSGGTYEGPASFGYGTGPSPREAYFLEFARRARGLTQIPLMLTGGFRSRAAMDGALEENALDVIGIARPVVMDPELGARLLEGKQAPRPLRKAFLPTRRLNAMAELAWYSAQLRLLAAGRDPDPRLNPAWAALTYLVGDTVRGYWRRLHAGPASAPRLPAGAAPAQGEALVERT